MKRILAVVSPDRATWMASMMFFLTSPAYYLCRSRHFCMAGHLQHPDDYTPLAYLTDVMWGFGFTSSILLVFRSGVTFRYGLVFALGVISLLLSDPRGIGSLLEIPVYVALCLFLIACMTGWIE